MITDPKVFLNDTTWKDVIINGSTFKAKPYLYNLKIVFNSYILNEFIPTVKRILPNITIGHYSIMLTHAHVEGFFPGSRSYDNNNPGNIGNTDSGANKKFATLEDGIMALYKFIQEVSEGKRPKSFPMGKVITLAPYYSKEIARNVIKYQKSPWVPGYIYTFTGQLDQYIKIYATSPRSSNNYINSFLTICKKNGIMITPETKIQDIIKLT